jgi:hypothetical protein
MLLELSGVGSANCDHRVQLSRLTEIAFGNAGIAPVSFKAHTLAS